MADVTESIRSFLLQSNALTALVSNRITPDVLPPGEPMPAVVYRRISTSHGSDIRGSKGGLARTRIEYECFAATRATANAVAEAIRLSGLLDVINVVHGTNFRSVQVDAGQRHYTEPPEDGSHEFRYVTSQDYAISYEENV